MFALVQPILKTREMNKSEEIEFRRSKLTFFTRSETFCDIDQEIEKTSWAFGGKVRLG
jgi:hypothetical protein